jgi:signal transduction histidine kinase
MMKRSIVGINAVIVVCFAMILLYQENWILLFLLALLLAGLYFLWIDRQKEYQSELGEISVYLDDLLQKKDISYYSVQNDTLTSKIFSQLTLLEDNRIEEAEKETYIKAVEKSENKLHFLIEKFIVAARLENQIIQIHKCDSNLKETVAQAVFQVRKKAEEKNINIIVQGEDADKKVIHDRNWLCEAIYNLLDNSIKYSPVSTDIVVTLISNEMFSEIRIEDSGTGIEKGEENKIFQLYYRGKNVSNEEGYGMGLFITREIVQKHDGFMKVKRKDSGLIMSIILPKAGT